MSPDTRHYCSCGHPRNHHLAAPGPCTDTGCACTHYERGPSVACGGCAHAASFHAAGAPPMYDCRSFGCVCDSWQAARPSVDEKRDSREARSTGGDERNQSLLITTLAGSVEVPFDLGSGDELRVAIPRRGPVQMVLSRPDALGDAVQAPSTAVVGRCASW